MGDMKINTTSGLSFEGGVNRSILEAALENGIHFEYSCKTGQCGVCKSSLLEGDVVELQSQVALTNADVLTGKILTCCCAPKSDVLIDAEDLSALKDIEVKTLPARINQIVRQSEHIIEINLRLPPTANLRFLEGQYIDVIGPSGIRRSYSIGNCVDEKVMKLYIKKLDNGVMSEYWFNEAKENDLLRIEGPKGSFFLRDLNKHIVFLATGTGIAPVKSILDMLERRENLPENMTFSLYWGNRYKDDFFWCPNYDRIKLKYVPVLSRAHPSWQGRFGYIQDAMIEDGVSVEDCQFYACGSLQMIESVHQLLLAHGMSEKHFHSDAFVNS
jgi:CDP-4-dehydro-6-deoxyglucose reductase, E3